MRTALKFSLIFVLLTLSLISVGYVFAEVASEVTEKAPSVPESEYYLPDYSSNQEYQQTPQIIDRKVAVPPQTDNNQGKSVTNPVFDDIVIDAIVSHPNDNEVDDTVFYGDGGYTISGVATDAANKAFPSVNVELYINKSFSLINSSTAYRIANIFDNQTAGIDGSYNFFVPLALVNVTTDFNYIVYYPDQDSGDVDLGIDCFNCAKFLRDRDVRVKDRLQVTYTRDPAFRAVGPSEQFEVNVTVLDTNGSPLPLIQRNALSVTHSFDYEVLTSGPNVLSGVPFDSSSIADVVFTYPGGGDDNITDTITLQGYLSPALKYYEIDDTLVGDSLLIPVSSDYTFDLSGTINGSPMINNQSSYFRLGQTLNITGDFANQTIVAPSTYQSIPWSVTISGGGYVGANPSNSGFTDSEGDFWFTISLDDTNFPDPSIPIEFSVTLTSPFANPEIFIVNMQSNVSALKNVAINTAVDSNGYINEFHYENDGTLYSITGDLEDEFGNPVKGLGVVLHFTSQNFPNDTAPYIEDITRRQLTISQNDGSFQFNFNIPGYNNLIRNMTMNVTLVTTDNVYTNTNGLNASVATFSYLHTTSITPGSVEVTYYNNTISSNFGNFPNIDMLNDTFALHDEVANNYYVNITIRDVYGRVPIGVDLAQFVDELADTAANEANSRNNTVYTVDATNNGIFIMPFSSFTTVDLSDSFKTWGSQYDYEFTIGFGQNFDIEFTQYLRSYTIFGPDNIPIDFSNLDVGTQFTVIGNDTDTNVNITIRVNLTDIGGLDNNWRNVTLSYVISNVAGIDNSQFDNSIFSGQPILYRNMTYQGGNIFETTFFFSNYSHGSWIKFNITAYDLAGFGIDSNGDTFGGNTWINGLPSYDSALVIYDPSIMNIDTLSNNGTSWLLKLGDTDIPEFQYNQSVLIGGQAIEGGVNITTTLDDVTISANLPVDFSGYENVTLAYRFLTFNETTGKWDTSVAYITLNMTFDGIDNDVARYSHTILSSELQFGTLLDFNIEIIDNLGNSFESPELVTAGGDLIEPISIAQVRDVDAPEQTAENFATLDKEGRQHPPNTVVVWTNETLDEYILQYNVTDFDGTGIDNILITWYVNGVPQLNNTLLDNGVIQVLPNANITVINQGYALSFKIPDTLFSGANVSWEVLVTDQAGNLAVLNEQNGDEFSFQITDPPEVVLPPSVTNTGDIEDPEQQGGNNALWIIAGFLIVIGVFTLYYQRHNIRDIIERRNRKRKVEGTLSQLMDEIKRLGAEGRYKQAILLTWEALERLAREILQSPRRYNQTAKEFALFLSTITIVDRDTLLTLSSTFELARYGKLDPTQDDFSDTVKAFEITVRTIIESGARTRLIDDDEDW